MKGKRLKIAVISFFLCCLFGCAHKEKTAPSSLPREFSLPHDLVQQVLSLDPDCSLRKGGFGGSVAMSRSKNS